MPHPIFFSVASPDAEFAERIYERYAADLIYLYSKNGKNGAWMWSEIEKEELPFSQAFIIFWSRSYIKNSGTKRELKFARERLDSGHLRHFAIIRLDDAPLFPSGTAETDEKCRELVELVAPFLKHVRADKPSSIEHAMLIVDSVVSSVERPSIPFFPRPEVQRDLREAARIDHFRVRPSVWVSGLNGYGRKTLIREFMREFGPDIVPVAVDIDETSLPFQIASRLSSRAFGTLEEDQEENQGGPEKVTALVESIAAASKYVVLRQTRIFEEGVELSEWLIEVFNGLSVSTAPKLFVVSQVPLFDEWLARSGDMLGVHRMPSMRAEAAEEFVWKLVGSLAPRPSEWSTSAVQRIVEQSGGTPELIIAIVKIASRLANLSTLDNVIGTQAAQFSDTMAALVSWAFAQLNDRIEEKRALLFMNDVSPVSQVDIQKFLRSGRPTSEIIGNLVALGLVEHGEDETVRLSPLLSRRLSSLLTTRDLVEWHREAMQKFASAPLDIEDGADGYLQIEAKIRAQLFSGRPDVDPELRRYTSQAHYLQIGIRLYNARRYTQAFRLLERAFQERSLFSLRSQIEIARFYGLAAIRLKNQERAIAASLMFLRSRHQGQSMADFLEAEQHRFAHEYDAAIPLFAKAQAKARGDGDRYREERIIRPYLESILRSRRPNLQRAKELADRAVRLSRTFFSLSMRVRVYLHLWINSSQGEAEKRREEYLEVLRDLEQQTGAYSFFAQAKAEEEEAFGEYGDAIEWMKEAVEASNRFDTRLRLWRLKTRSNDRKIISGLIDEIEEFVAFPGNRIEVESYAFSIADRYARALRELGELKQFRIDRLALPLSSREVRQVYLSARNPATKDWE